MPMPTFDNVEAIPEPFRSEYEEKDGKWHPKAPPAPDVTALNAALTAERQKAEDERKARNKVEKEVADLKRAADARQKGITEEQLAEIQAKEAAARKPLEDKLAAIEAENRKLKLTDRVKQKALAAGVMPDRIDKAMKDLEGRTDLTEDGNSIVVKDAAGKLTGESIDDFLTKTYPAEAPFYYKGSGTEGTGAEQSLGGNGQSSYDPVKAGKDAAAVQKKTGAERALAFQ